MTTTPFLDHLALQTEQLHAEGLYKSERVIASPQDAVITLEDGTEVINFCANNYLGLADDAQLIATAKHALDSYGYGMASVRFICGTQTVHAALEAEISSFLRTESTILYSSCWDANGGLFETILGPEDAIISDALNHASIIDGVRLCKAKRFRYANNNMDELRTQLEAARGARYIMIATDGVFSMDGIIANLPAICDLADGRWIRGPKRGWNPGLLGCYRQGHRGYRYARQGTWWRLRRIHIGAQGDHRLAASAVTPIPLLE
jgi:glycine C-acetyltransferase